MSQPVEPDLVTAVKNSLEKDGRMGKFKAELRAAVMSILNQAPSDLEPPTVPRETRLINDLLREYLAWNGYIYSEQILVAESGQSKQQPSRADITARLGVTDTETSTKLPLLYHIVSAFQMDDKDE